MRLWNEQDPILKERLFGLTGSEGNHGEDVKEVYFYLNGTPTHSYMEMLYKYPQVAYPYTQLVTSPGPVTTLALGLFLLGTTELSIRTLLSIPEVRTSHLSVSNEAKCVAAIGAAFGREDTAPRSTQQRKEVRS